MYRIRLLPVRHDDSSGVLIGAGGERGSDWPARVLANNVSTRIDLKPAREERSIARVQGQVVARLRNYIIAAFIQFIFFSTMTRIFQLKDEHNIKPNYNGTERLRELRDLGLNRAK